jgi:AmmeMemoRadiSam system protein A
MTAGSVGYTVAERRTLLEVARAAVRAAAANRPPPALPDDVPAHLREPAGVFVSLHDARRALRGCVGTVLPDGPLGESVARMAVAAATRDPRFSPLTVEELPGLRVEVSVLSPMWRAAAEEIDPAVHGVCVRLGRRHGVLLPQVAADRGWDRETLLAHVCEKAGLASSAWRDSAAMLFAFTVESVEGEV